MNCVSTVQSSTVLAMVNYYSSIGHIIFAKGILIGCKPVGMIKSNNYWQMANANSELRETVQWTYTNTIQYICVQPCTNIECRMRIAFFVVDMLGNVVREAFY